MFTLWCLSFGTVFSQSKTSEKALTPIDVEMFGDNSRHWYGIADPDNIINALPGEPRYEASNVRAIADNIVLFQKVNGGWPKNYDMMAILSDVQKDSVLRAKRLANTTFDNGTTYTHVAYLAKAYKLASDKRYRDAALRGLDFILKAQYENGGWPQYFPLENNYSRHITYNDGAMGGILKVLKEIAENSPVYNFVDNQRRRQLRVAYQKGIDCILRTQIRDNGKLTAWCQQHDEISLAPVWARKFEPPCISNGESAGLVLLLMSIKNPENRIVEAVKSAVQWFEDSKIYNTKVVTVKASPMDSRYRHSETDRVIQTDSTAPPIWTRYYELGTHRPMFCNRDSKVVYSLAEVERERRDGYAWYVYSPQEVLNQYPAWLKSVDGVH